ncbi:hypothetical protein Cflav_PD6073 [Pedosphaera parvula Ellin514]|uniref:Uncharacterized protein n=1 Tax=Pedosphaera parvula (strain Ellin514) TaxID=320771 RepID=B9XA97_PEDPL|nr:hypothetical protein Cflav_PD6073 [Pedosphaera parvula Ellin514]
MANFKLRMEIAEGIGRYRKVKTLRGCSDAGMKTERKRLQVQGAMSFKGEESLSVVYGRREEIKNGMVGREVVLTRAKSGYLVLTRVKKVNGAFSDSSIECGVKQRFFLVGVGELQGVLLGGGGHFLPGFLEGVDDFVIGGFAGEVGELVLEEDEAEGVFEDAAFGVVGEILFEVEILDAMDGVSGIADGAEDFTGFFGVEGLEFGTPLEVAGFGHRESVAGDFPAAKVLATGGEAEFFRGIRRQLQDPGGEAFGVEEFAGTRVAIDHLDIRVGCIMLVEEVQRRLKAGRISSLNGLHHNGIIIQLNIKGRRTVQPGRN